MQLYEQITIPSGPDVAYTITRPAGCVPAVSNSSTNAVTISYLDTGALSAVAPRGVSFRVTPAPTAGGHCGLACNAFGSQVITPEVFGAGVGFWTHANGLYFDDNLNIYAESWHINPGTTEASGAWADTMVIGQWVRGRSYQVDAMFYPDGAWAFSVQNASAPRRDYMGYPDQSAMRRFFSNGSSASDPVLANRIRAASVNGRTSKIAAFNAGVGTFITITPTAIYY